jgi:hypothetical protein
MIALVTLCDKGIKQSQSPRETDDSESNFQPCKVNLTHTLGTPKGRSEATVCLSFRLVDQSHHCQTRGHGAAYVKESVLDGVKRILLDVDAIPYVPAGFTAQNRPPAVSVRLLDFFPRSEELILTDCLNTGFNNAVSELPTTTRSAPALPYAAQRRSQSTEGKNCWQRISRGQPGNWGGGASKQLLWIIRGVI